MQLHLVDCAEKRNFAPKTTKHTLRSLRHAADKPKNIHPYTHRNAMPKFTLPIGFEIPSLKADINARCFDGGPFRHPIEYQLERFKHAETLGRGRFKIRQMAYQYTDQLMEQFPELQGEISYATLAEQIVEALIKEAR